jgi:hypothetical protein
MYQAPLTIAETVQDMDRKKYLLPSIQREFVWTTTCPFRKFAATLRSRQSHETLYFQGI